MCLKMRGNYPKAMETAEIQWSMTKCYSGQERSQFTLLTKFELEPMGIFF